MLESLSLITLGLATIGAYAKPVARSAASLEISLSTPVDKVVTASELRVVAIVENIGDEDLKVVKFGTALDNEHPIRSFIVTKDGKEVPFTGVETSVPTDDPSENDWVVIPVGGNVTAEHDVSGIYDFLAAGPGIFTFNPVRRFEVVGLGDVVEAKTTHSVSIIVTDEVSKRELNLEKRVTFQCDNQDNLGRVMASYDGAKSMARVAVNYLKEEGDKDRLYKTYFGWNTIEDVIRNFEAIAYDNSLGRNLKCNDHCGSSSPTVIDGDSLIFCNGFFQMSTPTCDSDGLAPNTFPYGVVLGELTRLILQTDSHAVGCGDSGKREHNDKFKISNTDNYTCFAAVAYKLRC